MCQSLRRMRHVCYSQGCRGGVKNIFALYDELLWSAKGLLIVLFLPDHSGTNYPAPMGSKGWLTLAGNNQEPRCWLHATASV